MADTIPFLKRLMSVPGLSGHEGPARQLIIDQWKPLCDEISVSRLGSVQGLKRGGGADTRPSLMLAAHMDAIGLIATGVENGFIRFTQVGGVDPRVLPGQIVTVYGRETLTGYVDQPPPWLLPPEIGDRPVPMENLFVDVGLPPDEVASLVRAGDIIAYAQEPVDLSGDVLAGHTLDDRSAVAAVTYCLEGLQTRIHSWDVWAVATVQEETSYGGAYTSTYGLNPDIGIAIDVCHAKGPGTTEPTIPPLGKGLALGLGPNIHPYIHQTFKNVADEFEIPHHLKPMAGHSGTDAYAIQVTASGKPAMVISIPLRYMHTPVEVVSIKDIKRVGRLLVEFISQLDMDYLKKINWDDKV